MKVLIKPGATLLFINMDLLYVAETVYDECHNRGIEAVLTSGNDGVHPKSKYHGEGYGWDFRVNDWPLLATMYQNIRASLKTCDTRFKLELELTPGNEHLHVHYAYDELIEGSAGDVVPVQNNLPLEA